MRLEAEAVTVGPGAVSILTRPRDRVRPIRHVSRSDPARFQSSPDHAIGCDPHRGGAGWSDARRFNPHPTTRSGATWTSQPRSATRSGFNPHPTTRSGATAHSEPVFFLYTGISGTGPHRYTSTIHRFWCRIPANPPSIVAPSPVRGLHDQRPKNVVLHRLAYDLNKP